MQSVTNPGLKSLLDLLSPNSNVNHVPHVLHYDIYWHFAIQINFIIDSPSLALMVHPPSSSTSSSTHLPPLSLTGWLVGKWQDWQTRSVPGLVSCRRGAKPPGGVSHHSASSRSNEGACRWGIPSPVSGIGRQISSASQAQHKWYVDKCRYFTFNWH